MSLFDTLALPLYSGYSGSLDANEWRASSYGAYDVFKKQSASNQSLFTAEDIANIKRSFNNVVKIPVLDLPDVTIGNTRTCNIYPDNNNSRMVQLTFTTYSFGFTMVRSLYTQNQLKYETDFQKKLRKYLLKYLQTLDAACLTKMNTDRNAVFTGLTAEYPALGGALQVPKAKAEDVYNQIAGIMNTADFPSGTYDVVANGMHRPLVSKLARNGQSNADNTKATLVGFEHHYTNQIASNTGVRDTLYIVPQGSVVIENRNDPDARAATSINGGSNKWSEVDLPMGVEQKVGLYYQEQCADTTSIFAGSEYANYTRAALESWEFSTDVVTLTSYVSNRTTKTAPIQKIEISAT